MKILSQVNPEIVGFQRIFEKLGHEWIWWPPHKPVFDAFDESKPNMVFTTDENSASLLKCLSERPTHWINIQKKEKYITWTYPGYLTSYPLPPLVDPLTYRPIKANPNLACDISFIGKVNPTMLRLCHPVGRYNIKIGGAEHWPIVQYIGYITLNQSQELYSSATLCFTDTVEEALKITACKGCFITMNQEAKEIWDKDEALIFEDEQDMEDTINNLLINQQLIPEIIERCYNTAIPQYTYMTFLLQLLSNTSLEKDTKQLTEYIYDNWVKR